jgi:hypothetical protein
MHSYTQKKIMRNPDPNRFEIEKKVQYKDFIFGNIDMYDIDFVRVVELKTKFLGNPEWKVRPFGPHVQQLKDLMSMGDISDGSLIYEVIGGKDPVVQFDYHLSSDERGEQLKRLEERAINFLNAKTQKDPSLAKHVFFDDDLRWLCDRIDRKTGEHIW